MATSQMTSEAFALLNVGLAVAKKRKQGEREKLKKEGEGVHRSGQSFSQTLLVMR